MCVCICRYRVEENFIFHPGQTYDLLAADYHADQLPRGKHSTKGLGRIAPDPAHNQALYVLRYVCMYVCVCVSVSAHS